MELGGKGMENRKHPRVPTAVRCWCEAETVTVYARAINLSEGGVFVHTHTPLAPGALTRLRLVASDEPITAQARVVWTREAKSNEQPAGMGLSFEGLEPGTLERLRELIRSERVVNAER
jgi:uncharacterized protein (TIGR02266 family)